MRGQLSGDGCAHRHNRSGRRGLGPHAHVAWSEEILDELRRNLLADYPDIDPDHFVSHTIGAMPSAFPDAMVTGFERWIERLDNNPKGRHVARRLAHHAPTGLCRWGERASAESTNEKLRRGLGGRPLHRLGRP
jgi:hypothetical protein